MAPNNEVGGLRTALAMGAARGDPRLRRCAPGSDALGHRQGARQGHRPRRARPGPRRHRISPTATPARCPSRSPSCWTFPSVTFAKSIAIDDGTAKVERQTEAGYDEVECPLPALVSVTAGVVEPRYPSFKGIMAAKCKPVDELSVADLGIDAGSVGWAGGGQEIVDIADAPSA